MHSGTSMTSTVLQKMAVPGWPEDKGELKIYENLDDLTTDFADYVAQLSEQTVKERGVFAVALSGGSLISLMGKLSEAPYDITVDWTKWYILWADERVVGKNHVDSNYKLAKNGLLSKTLQLENGRGLLFGVQADMIHINSHKCKTPNDDNVQVPVLSSHVHSINDNLTAEEAAAEYEFVLRQLVKTRTVDVCESSDCPKFDLILLGMGPDGHVASLFPGHPALEQREDWVTFLTDSPEPPPERITFTLPVINSASNVAIVVTGEAKAMAVHRAIDGITEESEAVTFPAQMIQPTEGKLVWFLDRSAASRLECAPQLFD